MTNEQKKLLNQRAKYSARVIELADAAEARETKELTPEETAERDLALREIAIIDSRLAAMRPASENIQRENKVREMDEFLKTALRERKSATAVLQRDTVKTTDVDAAVPLTIEDVVKPLEEGLILGKLGIPIRTGLAGDYCWPFVNSIEASIAGEDVALTDSDVDLTALTPTPVRLGVTVKMTYQAINQTKGLLYDVVREQIGMALTRAINRAMFCMEQFNTNFAGPFYNAKTKVTFAAATPTLSELLGMKGKVLATGVDPQMGTAAYVMSEYTKAILEATPTEAGGGRMVIENDKLGGYPVFCTNYINMGADKEATDVDHVGFGIFSYEPLGQFGDMRLVVDPYSGATNDVVRITLNSDWSMTTLRKEAFALGSGKGAGA